MSDINPNAPGGSVPPKPAEAAKVQPKKETVRINLPPKPTSAPTIKLPTLAPGAPMPSSVSAAAPMASAAAPRAVPPPPTAAPPPPVTRAPTSTGSSKVPAAVAAPAPAPRPQQFNPVQGIKTFDKVLAFAAAFAALAAIGTTLFLYYGIPGITRN